METIQCTQENEVWYEIQCFANSFECCEVRVISNVRKAMPSGGDAR